MNILMIYPKYPYTYWSFTKALRFVRKKAIAPPLGLITVASMLPSWWNKKLVDLNISSLNDEDISWADFIFISSMSVQNDSAWEVIERCAQFNATIVAGGPLFTQEHERFPKVNHFILNEAEITLPLFLEDLMIGKPLQRVYSTPEFADITRSPIPDFTLLTPKEYAFMNIQVTRGCPYSCEFCEITSLFGRKVRMKNTSQIMEELDAIYNLNWRGTVSIVDDNFIGKKHALKTDLLPAMITWMKKHNYPFVFNCQSSINLADDEELIQLMVDAGFDSAFIGIETPSEESLHGCNKVQNENRDLLGSVLKIQKSGIKVSAGFIVGFDDDTPSVFERQIDFIQQSGIVSAMVGLLNAPKNTLLYKRLKNENRLTAEANGNNTDTVMNFIPKMNQQVLMEGYDDVIRGIYSVKPYYKRIRQFLRIYGRQQQPTSTQSTNKNLLAFFRAVIYIGILSKGWTEYWKLLFWTLIHRPKLFVDAVKYAVFGYHYRTVYGLVN